MNPDKPVAPGQYTVRVDQLGKDGRVSGRIEMPFTRGDSVQLAGGETQVVVQPGNSLWRIARRTYGADIDPRLTVDQKEACWQAWIAHYTRHQPAQRVDYALRRVEAFESGEPPLALPGLTPGTPPPGTDRKLASLVHYADYGASVETDAGAGSNGCLEACSTYEASCVAACPEEDRNSCRQGCTRERSICLGGCH